MRVLVCGSRDWTDRELVDERLDAVMENMLDIYERTMGKLTVVHGACADPKTKQLIGADGFADDWAKRRGFSTDPYPADWHPWPEEPTRLDRSAGPRRNALMASRGKPDIVLAFSWVTASGKLTDGTDDMVKKALAACVPVRIWTARQP